MDNRLYNEAGIVFCKLPEDVQLGMRRLCTIDNMRFIGSDG